MWVNSGGVPVSLLAVGVRVCDLPRWQCRQTLAIMVMALAICGQQNRVAMRRRNRDVTNGLWLMRRRNCRPSSRNLKCLTALNAASSSLSKVEYLVPTSDSFLE